MDLIIGQSLSQTLSLHVSGIRITGFIRDPATVIVGIRNFGSRRRHPLLEQFKSQTLLRKQAARSMWATLFHTIHSAAV